MTDISMVLDRVGKTLAIEVSPHLDGHYAGGHVVLSGLMAVMAGEAFDGTVDRMLHEISDMRTLLEEGGVDPGDTRGTSMRVSALQIVHNGRSEKLMTLQIELDAREDQEANRLNARIWQFFVEGADARMPTLPDFQAARAQALKKVLAEKADQG